MLLKAFLTQYGDLGDELLVHFKQPFLVQEGRLEQLEESGAAARQVFFLEDSGQPLVVSRSASKGDIHIADRNISGRHAEFQPPSVADAWTLIDLGSTNGTFLNGEQVEPRKPYRLRDEAVIGFGPLSSFVFLQPNTFLSLLRQLAKKEGLAERRSPKREGVSSRTTVRMMAMPLEELQRAQPAALPRRGAEVSEGELFLERDPFPPVPLKLGMKLSIGRSDVHADIVLPHPLVSRRHAEVQVRPEGVYVRDLRSANGTVINGRALGTDPVRLGVDQVVTIADFRLILRSKRAAGEEQVDLGRTMVAAPRAAKRKLIKGNFQKTSLNDLLAGIEEKSKSGLIVIQGKDVQGRIAFQAGSPVFADTSTGLQDEAAVAKLLQVERSATFTLDPSPQNFGPRRITRSFSDLLLEDFLA